MLVFRGVILMNYIRSENISNHRKLNPIPCVEDVFPIENGDSPMSDGLTNIFADGLKSPTSLR